MSKTFKCCTTQINLPPEVAAHIRQFTNIIPDAELAGSGRDTGVPHVTLRWGVLSENLTVLQQIVDEFFPFPVILGLVKTFPPSLSSEGASVLYVEIKGPPLAKIHQAIGERMTCQPYDFEYNPHATIAYIKPEACVKYEDCDALQQMGFFANNLTFSNRLKQQTTIYRKGYQPL